jgi:chromosome segregation ATPase
VIKKDAEIADLEKTITNLKSEIVSLNDKLTETYQVSQTKDVHFHTLREQINKIYNDGCLKDVKIEELKNINHELSEEIDRLNRSLSTYNEPDRRLFDFRGNGQHYEALNNKKSLNSDRIEKELEKVKKDKISLEIELSALQEKLEDRENRFRQLEEENRKKNSLKDRKTQEL